VRSVTLLTLVATAVLALLLPLLFGELMLAGLSKLHLSSGAAAAIFIAIVAGGMVNIPVKRVRRDTPNLFLPLGAFGMWNAGPRWSRARPETVIAVNLGGCVIPGALAVYEALYLAAVDPKALTAMVLCCVGTTLLCYAVARPRPGVGIVMPGLLPALTAAALALFLAPGEASPVAFIAGVAGPLIGADLLHLRDIQTIAVGVASIGGAGTFDGIVLSGIVAAYLA